MDRPLMGRGVAREELAGKAAQEERRVRDVRGREEGYFSFSWEKVRRYFLYLLGSRSATTAALGYRRRRANNACADCGSARKTQLVVACGRSSFSSLYTLDTYVGAQSGRNGWMSVFSSLCIYSISQILAVVKNGKWKKMEGMEKSGRRGIAGDGD